MTRAIGRAIAAAAIAGLLGAAAAALFYAWHPAVRIEFDRDFPARTVSGIYPPERDDNTGLTFAWTGADAVLRLPGIDRGANWTVTLRVRGGRAAADQNPIVEVVADGAVVAAAPSGPDWSEITATIPRRPQRRGLLLNIRSSSTFVPGGSDPRALGVMLDRIVLSPDAVVLVPRPALVGTSLASAAMGVALALLGVTAGSAIGGAVLLCAGAGAVVAKGFGPFTDFPDTATALGIWIGLGLALLALARDYFVRQPLRNTARFAAAFAASAVYLKLLVLLHPNMPIGDAMFHAHRFQGVLSGKLLFTSIAPGGYAFPYPPGLYVFASAFAGLVRRGASDVALLRIITCAADAAVSVLLYWVIAAAWRNRVAGAIAVAIYHLIPLNFGVLTTGNLTNAFAQSLAVGALVLMGSDVVAASRRWSMAVLAVVLAAAYLSHTSTLAILFVATVATAALFAARGDRSLRWPAGAIATATSLAAVIAVAVYYAHFMDTYRAEFSRIGHETAANASDAGGRTIGDRLLGVPYSVRIFFGMPVVVLAVLGAVLRFGRHTDRLTLAIAGWVASCVLFLAIGILTPVDMRYYLAAIPAAAVLAAWAAAWAWHERPRVHRTAWRAAAAILLAATAVVGFRNWWNTLG